MPTEIFEIRGEPWIVARRDSYEDCAVLSLEGRGPGNFGKSFQVVEPFDRARAMPAARLRRRKRNAVLRHAWSAILSSRSHQKLQTAAAARIDLLPYQLAPALAVLGGATRVLLADEVGLGKTVQAALILAELRERGLVARALVLVPAGLRRAWAGELQQRFAIDARVVDQASIAQLAATWAHVNPWADRGVTIASIDFAKRTEVLAAIDDVPLDLLIVDEAHHLTPGSDRGAAVARLALRSQWVVLISATPHSGDDRAFQFLTNIGRAGDDMAIFRRRRLEVRSVKQPRRRLIPIAPTPNEAALLAGVESYARSIWRARGAGDSAVRLVAVTLARRAASSAAAIGRTLARRLALLDGKADPLPAQTTLPWGDADHADEDEAAAHLALAGLDDSDEERRRLEALIALAIDAERNPSKIRWLQRLTGRTRESIVIFTEFRDTLDAVERSLAGAAEVIHGGVPPEIRHQRIDRFNCGQTRILIATDAGGEGLNLHHRCRSVCTMELPWNPQRLDQRVGRVDRIGQTRRVHAAHLFHAGSIEDRVLASLERRRWRAETTLSERDLADAALGDVPLIGRQIPMPTTLEDPGSAFESARIAAERSAAATPNGRRGASGWAPAGGRWRNPRAAIAVFECELIDSDAGVIERTCLAIRCALSGVCGGRDWRTLVDSIESEIRISPELERSSCEAAAAFAAANLRRIAHIRRALEKTSAALRQTSLFDRRAEREAALGAEVRSRLEAHLARRAARLESWRSRELRQRCCLIAVWPER